jgi:hypothetical protein
VSSKCQAAPISLATATGNGSHETIVLDHQWQAYAQATNGHFLV